MKMNWKPIIAGLIVVGVVMISNYPVFIMEHIITPGQLIIYIFVGMIYLSVVNYLDKKKETERRNKEREISNTMRGYIGNSETFDIAQSFKKKRIKSIKK